MNWLHALIDELTHGERACLVTVAKTKGSAPREAGAAMVVTARNLEGSIGGGQLEYQALTHARNTLAAKPLPTPRLEEITLGPQRGQCCGGKVWLAYEWYDPGDRAHIENLKSASAISSTLNSGVRLPMPVDDPVRS
ncbi:MAG: XdhC family protein, partial [Pseudomonadota bacterium]